MFKYFNLQWIYYTGLHSHAHLFSSFQLSQLMSLISILSYDIYTESCHCQVSFALYRWVVTYIKEQIAIVLLGRYRISILVGEIIKVLSLSLSLPPPPLSLVVVGCWIGACKWLAWSNKVVLFDIGSVDCFV